MKLGFEESQSAYCGGSRSAWTGLGLTCTIHIVQNGFVRTKELVLAEWQKPLFLRRKSPETRGRLLDVMKCVESLGKRDFA